AADRLDHLQREVRPALRAGTDVICDRYVLSSMAYQGSMLPADWVREINARAMAPVLTLFIDVEPAVARERRARRGGPPELFDADERQAAAAARYRDLAAKAERLLRVDGGKPVDEVTRECLAAIEGLTDG